jgi:colanic acid/amylovoran biosynthesis glycosyltransferase
VTTVTLHDPDEHGVAEFADLERGTIGVYGSGAGATARAAIVEPLAHPLRTIRTFFTALRDALNPGERLSPGARAKLLGQAFMSLGLARRLRRAGVRHVHCHFAHAPASLGMYAARQLGIPFSFTGHANDLFQRRALLRRKLERAAFVSCISEWHREFYRGVFPGGAERYHVIRCGVDVESWIPKAGADRDIPRGQPLHVLSVCRLVEKKGVDTLLRAMAQFGRETGRAWQLTVAGDGPDRESLNALANELGCHSNVEWLGAVTNDRVRELLGRADVFALPCREDRGGDRDGIPVVLIEAMACGVPAVSGDLPAIRELVQHGRTGVLVEGNRPDQVAAELAALADDPSLRATLAHGGRQHVQEEFSLSANIRRLMHRLGNADEPGAVVVMSVGTHNAS